MIIPRRIPSLFPPVNGLEAAECKYDFPAVEAFLLRSILHWDVLWGLQAARAPTAACVVVNGLEYDRLRCGNTSGRCGIGSEGGAELLNRNLCVEDVHEVVMWSNGSCLGNGCLDSCTVVAGGGLGVPQSRQRVSVPHRP